MTAGEIVAPFILLPTFGVPHYSITLRAYAR
jgi:hypothetical protein